MYMSNILDLLMISVKWPRWVDGVESMFCVFGLYGHI